MLDAEENLHLALHASSVGQHHACMTYLKAALLQQPGNAKAMYLLATQHAELGLIERAIRGMQAALAAEPRLQMARFHLGLLLLDQGRPAEAKEQFRPLESGPDPALCLYAQAMTALADDDRAAARERLTAGLAQASGHKALAHLMRRILDRISRQPDMADKEAEPGTSDESVFLGAYRHARS